MYELLRYQRWNVVLKDMKIFLKFTFYVGDWRWWRCCCCISLCGCCVLNHLYPSLRLRSTKIVKPFDSLFYNFIFCFPSQISQTLLGKYISFSHVVFSHTLNRVKKRKKIGSKKHEKKFILSAGLDCALPETKSL